MNLCLRVPAESSSHEFVLANTHVAYSCGVKLSTLTSIAQHEARDVGGNAV